MATKSLTLATGNAMPQLAFGTWKMSNDEAEKAVADAIDTGYRHIDTALAYDNEVGVGRGIAAKIADGTVRREELFVTTKLWATYHGRERVAKGLARSLERLQLDYVDLYLIHWPCAYEPSDDTCFPTHDDVPFAPVGESGRIRFADIDYVETWRGMEDAQAEGGARDIGVSNFNTYQLERIFGMPDLRTRPAVNQVEMHVYLNQKALGEFCQRKNVIVQAYSVLGSGDRPWSVEADPAPLADAAVAQVASKHSCTPAQVLIAYPLKFGYGTIAKTTSAERMKENFRAAEVQLDADDMSALNALNCDFRFCTQSWEIGHPRRPIKPGVVEGGRDF